MSSRIDESKDAQARRRLLLTRLVKAGLAAWAAGVITPALVYLWPARKGAGTEGPLDAGPVGDIAVGDGKLFEAGGRPVLVLRVAENEYHALSAVCTHLGCVVEWRKEKGDVFCACHGGRFDNSGKVLGGPPPKPLAAYPVAVRDERLEVDLRVKGEGT